MLLSTPLEIVQGKRINVKRFVFHGMKWVKASNWLKAESVVATALDAVSNRD